MAEKMTEQELEEATQRILTTLTPREQAILAMRFGIEGEIDIKSIVKRFEETVKRVRKIEAKALRKIRGTPNRKLKL